MKLADVLDQIDHRGRQIHEGEMGLWVRASEWDFIRQVFRELPSVAVQHNAALDDAAARCDELASTMTFNMGLSGAYEQQRRKATEECATAIRALKRQF